MVHPNPDPPSHLHYQATSDLCCWMRPCHDHVALSIVMSRHVMAGESGRLTTLVPQVVIGKIDQGGR